MSQKKSEEEIALRSATYKQKDKNKQNKNKEIDGRKDNELRGLR